jgi:DNA polymerase (family 10)
VERLARQRDAVQAARERHPDIEVLHATEVDILADGSLDLPDEVLAGLDWVTASVHSAFRAGPRRMTERLLRAVEHPLVDAIGHPTGRMRERRPSSEMNFPQVIEAAARTGTCLEINAQPRRLDLDATAARAALAAGARLVIGSDAHSTDAFDLIRFGVVVARRAGAGAGDIANCRTWPELRDAGAARLAAGRARS